MIVYFVCRYFYPYIGGNEKQCMALAKGLKDYYRIDVRIVTDLYSPNLLSSEEIESIPVTRIKSISNLLKVGPYALWSFKKNIFFRIYHRFRYTSTEYFFQLAVLFFLFKNKKKIDIVHFHQGSFSLFAQLTRHLIKKPVLIKDSTYDGLKIFRYLTVVPISYKFHFRKINFIAVSAQIKDNFIAKYGITQDKIFLIPNGIEVLYKEQKPVYISRNIPKLLFLGNFWQGRIKGLDILLLALSQVKVIFPNVKLVIAGSGNINDYNNIINRYSLWENIEYIGSIAYPAEIFKETPIYILPSRSEGMSNSLLEAMASGLPCISSKVSGSTDIIDDGLNGYLFNIDSVDDLVKCILTLLNNPCEQRRLGEEAIRKINSSFKMEIIVQKYNELYASLIL